MIDRACRKLWGMDVVVLRRRFRLRLASEGGLAAWFVWLLLAQGVVAGESPRVGESALPGRRPSDSATTETEPDGGVVKPAQVLDADKPNGAFAGRTPGSRRAALERCGGSQQSEAAVKRALQWIVDHQLPDGGWCFDHRIGPVVNGRARTSDHPGSMTGARNAATAMALLPLLGAGHTHKQGDHQQAVQAGLDYLGKHQKPNGGWHETQGTMYAHGLAAIAFCEAFGMTQDAALMPRAQASVNFLSYAQDPVGGGWRYTPRQRGDTSVTGWQFAALKTGQMAFLQVNPNAIRGASKFLDSVEKDGAYYGYTTPGQGHATTAIGMLCRMYLGRERDVESMSKGIEFLSSLGPSTGAGANLYYDYHATQVLRHYGGEPWEKWNAVMRDFLVSTQATEGPVSGSWHFAGGHGSDAAGRLYNTSLATLILEVYYRHPPIYAEP